MENNTGERIKKLIKFKRLSIHSFEKLVGLGNNVIGTSIKRNSSFSSSTLSKILLKYPEVNPDWLITGRGNMFISDPMSMAKPIDAKYEVILNQQNIGIPLVSVTAIGGFSSSNFSISEQDISDHYVIPIFKNKKIDFMIEVEGSSMYPKYSNGDIVACTIIKNSTFIQWNRVYVIAIRGEGIIVKRLKISDKDSCIKAVSDNISYDPFDIPKDEILSMALVVGVIKLE